MRRLAALLKRARGSVGRVHFARQVGLSYTFVRAVEHGERYPSDKVLLEIAECLGEDPEELFLAVYCDRSPYLAQVLRGRGITLPEGEEEDGEAALDTQDSLVQEADTLERLAAQKPASIGKSLRATGPF
jgi:transcriptional regulator with XRE-family HTH domain